MSRAPRSPDAGPVTPWNPSRRATAKVLNPLPLPDTCRLCGGACRVLPNEVVYGKPYGKWPWMLVCLSCGAQVGLHPFTGIPLGTVARKPLRELRKAAKAAFNPLWQGPAATMTRTQAYTWLAGELGMHDIESCHIGWMEEDQCKAAMAAIQRRNA